MINLEIVTPEKKVIDEQVDVVNVPTPKGEIGILPNHAPLISTLKAGILSYTNKGNTEKMVVLGGFVEVKMDKVSILADVVESSGEIDVKAAETAREDAQKTLGDWKGSKEELGVELDRLEKAQARLALTPKN